MAPGFVLERVGEAALLLGLERRNTAELNCTAAEALSSLDGIAILEEVVSRVSALFGVDRDNVMSDLGSLFGELLEAGVIVEAQPRVEERNTRSLDGMPVRYVAITGVVLCKTNNDKAYLIHPEGDKMIALNSGALALWHLCDVPRTATEIAREAWGAQDADVQIVLDVEEVLGTLAELGLVVPTSARPHAQSPEVHHDGERGRA